MATRRKLKDLSPWPALLLEGQLLTASTVQKVVDQDADQQRPTDYGLHKNMNLRNEIDIRFRLGQSRYQAFVGSNNVQANAVALGLAETKRFVTDLLHETLGFDDLSLGEIPLAAIAGQGRIPVVVCDPQHSLDERTDALSTTRSQSANTALQDYLNDQEDALWGIACNGHTLRLMRDNESLTRPAYVEFDLQHIFENEDVSSFAALWMLLHRSRFGVADAPVTDCSLERWKEQGTKDGEAIRDDLAKQVTEALKALGSGFLNDNASLRENLTSQGDIDLVDFFNELLRLVYRLIFLMVAEDRNLLHHPNKSTQVARKLYADGYGTQQLREISLQRDARDQYSDRYEALKIVLEALSETDATRRDILGLPALGGLFGAGRSPILEGLVLSNEALLRAVYKLGYFQRDEATTAVNWGQMETEELGSVYESLLELQPQLGPFGKTLQFANEVAEKKGNQRKTTGSYYTPDSLVQALLDTALDSVLERIEKEANSETDAAERMLGLTVIDPACGSGHFLLAAARRMATRIARLRHEGTPSLADYRHALREVARGCLYGVDRNPMAVELAQVALWIETIDPGYPLGFFDAQIRCGDSLLGVFDLEVLEDGIPDGAYKALTGDDKETAKYYKNVNKKYRDNKATEFDFAGGDVGVGLSAKPVVKSFASMFRMPEEELWQVRKKAARYVELRESEEFQKLYRSADLYIGAFLTPKVGEQPTGASAHTIPTTIELYQALAGNPLSQNLSQAVAASRKARAFHWPLEFPHVMEVGGFDVVLGNPPWEVMQLSETEYFANRAPEIAELKGATRKRAIKELASERPELWKWFVIDKRQYDALNEFARESGRFDLTARGKVNTYGLFAELFMRLSYSTTSGNTFKRAGIIVPTGISTDATTAPFFGALVEGKRLASLVDFENREKLFPAVDSRMKFCLLTLGSNEPLAHFAFFLTHPAQLAEEARNFTLSPEEIAAINPNTKTAPVFRSKADAELTAKIYRNVPVLIDESKGEEGNPWGIEFRQGLFNMTSDSNLFRTYRALESAGYTRAGTDWVKGEERYVPLYEAKMIHQFDHRWATYDEEGETVRDVTLEEKQDPNYEPLPRYWVPKKEVEDKLAKKGWDRDWLMGWRDISNATNERTVIATVFPRVGVGNNLPLMLFDQSYNTKQLLSLAASLSSLVTDFASRFKVGGTHLNFFVYRQIPVLPPLFFSDKVCEFITERAFQLYGSTYGLAKSLAAVQYAVDITVTIRQELRAELDAFFACGYGLTRDELRYVLDPADVMGEDYPSETFRVLKEKEIRLYGEYRTRRLVLEAWDRLEEDGVFEELGV